MHDRAGFDMTLRRLERDGRVSEAYDLGKTRLERADDYERILPDVLRLASRADRLDECLAILLSLAEKRPDDAALLNYIAGLFGEMGDRERSRAFARRSAALQPFFPSRAKNPRMHLLALQCIATPDYKYSPLGGRFALPGLTNLYTLLDPAIAVHRLLVDDLPAALEAVKAVPPPDIVFNTISDPDYTGALENAAAVCDALARPVYNHPHKVRALNRASLPGLLRNAGGRLMAAKTVFLPPGAADGDIGPAMEANGLPFPVIVRAPGFQGGRHMALLRDNNDKPGGDLYRDGGLYVIEFIDVSFRDARAPGAVFYPKYRAFVANGRLYPMHLFVAENYEVHRETAAPVRAAHPWLAAMEADYIDDPAGHLPGGLWAAMQSVLATIGPDYYGVDFAVSSRPGDNGAAVIFEANPAMRNGLVFFPDGGRIQRQWHAVTHAAHAALCERSGIAPWPFALKKGLRPSL